MANWERFEEEADDLARVARDLWVAHGIMYMATIRPDGSPRVHRVVPLLAEGDVLVAVADRSPKWRDVQRDPRCVLHALPGRRDDELVMRCRAREHPDALAKVRAVAAHVIHDDDHIIDFDIEQIDLGWWELVGQPGTYPARNRWTPGEGVRHLPGLRAAPE